MSFSHHPQHPNRIALSSYLTGPHNKVSVIEAGLSQGEFASPTGDPELQPLAMGNLAFPATRIGWEPAESLAAGGARHELDGGRGELLATTGDVLRIWELKPWDGGAGGPNEQRVGYRAARNGYTDEYSLSERSVLSNVSRRTENEDKR